METVLGFFRKPTPDELVRRPPLLKPIPCAALRAKSPALESARAARAPPLPIPSLAQLTKVPRNRSQVKKWRQTLREQTRELDRQIRAIDSQEAKVKQAIKAAAKRNDTASCRVLAKEIARSRKAKERMFASKAQLGSLEMQLKTQLATAKIAGSLKQSTDIMKLVNNLIKLPEIQKNMMEMSKEMMKAGIISEMMDDAIDAIDEDGIEEEADAQVDSILAEITDGMFVGAGKVGAPLKNVPANLEEEEEDDAMEKRLAALRAE